MREGNDLNTKNVHSRMANDKFDNLKITYFSNRNGLGRSQPSISMYVQIRLIEKLYFIKSKVKRTIFEFI